MDGELEVGRGFPIFVMPQASPFGALGGEVPEHKKPRKIAIDNGAPAPTIEAVNDRQAA